VLSTFGVMFTPDDHAIADLAALLPWRWAAESERRKLAA
jgi:hypothetical protein